MFLPNPLHLTCGDRKLDLSRPRIMGVLNVTSDSFSDGGRYLTRDAALRYAEVMVAQGADIVDVGGESTRPGALPVSASEEIDRVAPVIEALRQCVDVVVSVDTSKTEVMTSALQAGAHMINDVLALRATGALETVAQSSAAVCLMHMLGEPRTMQQAPVYNHVVEDVIAFLHTRLQVCEEAGIARDRVCIDPGFGFGKTLDHNLALFRNLEEFQELGCPVVVGVSRKSMIGQILGKEVPQRLYGSISLAGLAVWLGAAIIRCHDVEATCDAVAVVEAVRRGGLLTRDG